MADQFQIPQRNPQYVAPVAPPTDLINSLYARQKPGEILTQGVQGGLNNFLDQYYKQKELQAKAFGEGGPYLYNLLYGKNQPGGPTAPNTPPITASASVQPQPPNTAQGTPPGQVAGQEQPQSSIDPMAPGGTIHTSLSLGHPDFAGYGQQIGDITGQMVQGANLYGPSKFGQANQQMLGGQLNALKTGMEAQKAPLEYTKTANEVAMQPGQAALQHQQLLNAQQQIPMEINKSVAGEVSKQGENTTRVGQLRGLFNDLKTAAENVKPGLGAGISGHIANFTGGKYGSTAAADLQNVSAPMTAALNYELTKRFNESEADFLMKSMMPNPIDQPAFREQKLKRLDQMISALESGNDQNIKNVASAIGGGAVVTKMPQPKHQTAIPQGRITVKDPQGRIGHIPASQLKEALAAGYVQQ